MRLEANVNLKEHTPGYQSLGMVCGKEEREEDGWFTDAGEQLDGRHNSHSTQKLNTIGNNYLKVRGRVLGV